MLAVEAKAKTAYSLIRHLGGALWLYHDPARCWMAMFTAYYDASGQGSDKEGALVVAGVVATEDKHIQFEAAWRAVLGDFSVPYLHMKEFAHSVGAFAEWKGNESRRASFLGSLVGVMKRNLNKTFSVWLPIAEFKALTRQYSFPGPLKKPFVFCASNCSGRIERWIDKQYHGQPVAHVFEAGDLGLGEFVNAAPHLRQGSVAAVPKVDPRSGKRLCQFEAADFLAWEGHDIYSDALAGERVKLRASFLEVRKQLPHDGQVFTKDGLTRMCREHPEIYPPRC